MASDQPYEDEPEDEDDFIVNETTNLDQRRGDESYTSWDFEFSGRTTIRGRAIARGHENIRFYLMEADEFGFYEDGDDFWVEHQSASARHNIDLSETLKPGGYVLVVEGPPGNGGDGPEVTVEVWER